MAPQYFAGPQPQNDGDGEQGGGDLLQYWRILNRHKGIVVLAALIGVVFAVLVTIPQAPVYQAHATVEVQDTNKDLVKQIGPEADAASFNATGDVNTQVRIMQSETLVSRVMQKLAAPSADEEAAPTGFLSKLTGKKKKVRAGTNLKIRPIAQSRIIEITFDSTDPAYAADFINTLTAEYISFNMEARVKMNQRATEWMNKQVEELKQKLADIEKRRGKQTLKRVKLAEQ